MLAIAQLGLLHAFLACEMRNAKCLERKNGCGLAMVSANVFQVIRFRPSKFKELASSEHREKTCPPLRFFGDIELMNFPEVQGWDIM